MKAVRSRLVLIVTALSAVLMFATPAAADEANSDHCRPPRDRAPKSAYQGLAFIGTIRERWISLSIPKRGAVSGNHYDVERVIDGKTRTHIWLAELGSGACGNVEGSRLKVGDRLLISGSSTRRLGNLRYLEHEIIWRAVGPDSWRFARDLYLWPGLVPAVVPRRTMSTAEVVALLVGELPPTDTPLPARALAAQPSHGRPAWVGELVAATLAIAAGLAFLARTRRRTSAQERPSQMTLP